MLKGELILAYNLKIATLFIAIVVVFICSVIFYRQFFKRFYDILLSGLAIAILSPLLLILTLLGAIFMSGNPFFTQLRPGKIDKKTNTEKIFKLIKFRTMSNKKDECGNLLPDEQRLNAYGKFLRKTSLDELPELICILVGDMSIIGPRPLLVEYLPYYTDRERHRHDVRPGLTGYAQINGRNSVCWEKRFEYDLEYIDNLSFFGDFRVILSTIKIVLKHSGIADDTNQVEGNFAEIREAQQGILIKSEVEIV